MAAYFIEADSMKRDEISGASLLDDWPIVSFDYDRWHHAEHDQDPSHQASIPKQSVDHEPLLNPLGWELSYSQIVADLNNFCVVAEPRIIASAADAKQAQISLARRATARRLHHRIKDTNNAIIVVGA